MGGSDGNAQARQYYSFNKQSFWYWWPIFRLFIDASVVNAFTLWKIAQPHSNLTHQQFQHEIATENRRQRVLQVEGTGRPAGVPPPEHNWVHLPKRQYCLACCVNKIRV